MPTENELFEYGRRYVEIYIDDDTGEYVQYDHKKGKEIERRPATAEEVIAFRDD